MKVLMRNTKHSKLEQKYIIKKVESGDLVA